MIYFRFPLLAGVVTAALLILGCSDSDGAAPEGAAGSAGAPHDPAQADKVAIDRFSDAFANLFRRSANPALPLPNTPFSFDDPSLPFHARGLGPNGEKVEYYNFDVARLSPAKLYRVVGNDGTPVPGQLDIATTIPGDAGSNDFVRVSKVQVPGTYQANSLASEQEVLASGYPITETAELRNVVMVPFGTTASLRYGKAPDSVAAESGWYKGKLVQWLGFDEKPDVAVSKAGTIPAIQIFVTFNKNPDAADPTSGPPSGFVIEPGSSQTHNVVAYLPQASAYSPLWLVNVYDNADFASVHDLASAQAAKLLGADVAAVNCPLVAGPP